MYSLCSMQILYLLSAWQTAGIVIYQQYFKILFLKKVSNITKVNRIVP